MSASSDSPAARRVSPAEAREVLAALPAENRAQAEQIAAQLNETFAPALQQMQLILHYAGEDQTAAWLDEILAIEAAGGLLTHDGKRKRTPGGAFLRLVRDRISDQYKNAVFYFMRGAETDAPKKKKKKRAGVRLVVRPTAIQFLDLISILLEAPGGAHTVKITLIGRPGQIEQRDQVVVTMMQHQANFPTLPRGLPEPPSVPTTYLVYMPLKQWTRVAEAVSDPRDSLIIEGQCAFDPAIDRIVVYALNVTTKSLERAKREARDADRGVRRPVSPPRMMEPPRPLFSEEPPRGGAIDLESTPPAPPGMPITTPIGGLSAGERQVQLASLQARGEVLRGQIDGYREPLTMSQRREKAILRTQLDTIEAQIASLR